MILGEMEIFEQPAERLGLVLHYVIARTVGFGAIKLNKAVCAADAEFYRRYGRSITGAISFQKQKFGPVPNGVVKELDRLRESGKITPLEMHTPVGVRRGYASQIEPEIFNFDAKEIDVINIAIASLERISANEASERSHDALWDEIEPFGQIPIQAAAFQPIEIDQETLSWALSDGC
jgi:hypothetical protein